MFFAVTDKPGRNKLIVTLFKTRVSFLRMTSSVNKPSVNKPSGNKKSVRLLKNYNVLCRQSNTFVKRYIKHIF